MKILLAADGSPYTSKAATFLSTHLEWFQEKPELHLLHVKLPIPSGLAVEQARKILGDPAVDDYYRDESKAALAPAETIFREQGIPFESHYKVGEVAPKIQAYAAKHGIDLIVMGSHGHSALMGVVLGSVATKVLAMSTVPVLIVR